MSGFKASLAESVEKLCATQRRFTSYCAIFFESIAMAEVPAPDPREAAVDVLHRLSAYRARDRRATITRHDHVPLMKIESTKRMQYERRTRAEFIDGRNGRSALDLPGRPCASLLLPRPLRGTLHTWVVGRKPIAQCPGSSFGWTRYNFATLLMKGLSDSRPS